MNLKNLIKVQCGISLLLLIALFTSCNSGDNKSNNKPDINLATKAETQLQTKIENEDILRSKIDSSVFSNYGGKAKVIGKRVYIPTGNMKQDSKVVKEIVNPNLVFGEARLLIGSDTSYWRIVFENGKIIHEGKFNPN